MYFVSGITKVHNESYETIIDTYDNDDTLFYCDPPYYKMEDYYVQDFQRHQHKELAEKLKNIKGKFVLSYYDFPELETWFQNTSIFGLKKNLINKMLVKIRVLVKVKKY